MIPLIIHSCWLGHGSKPELVLRCQASWHHYMPDWHYMEWNEESIEDYCQRNALPSPFSNQYCREAYEAHKFAFASDYIRLWALEHFGGLYMDVDFEVYKPFDDLMNTNDAFAGIEGSRYFPVMMGVCASRPHGEWVREMLDTYSVRPFIIDGEFDLTPNTAYLSSYMEKNGFVRSGKEQTYKDLHIFTSDYFSPRMTTGEFIRTNNTYCSTCGLNSWAGPGGWKVRLLNRLPNSLKVGLIKLKRRLF